MITPIWCRPGEHVRVKDTGEPGMILSVGMLSHEDTELIPTLVKHKQGRESYTLDQLEHVPHSCNRFEHYGMCEVCGDEVCIECGDAEGDVDTDEGETFYVNTNILHHACNAERGEE